jgi:hypothetical protein
MNYCRWNVRLGSWFPGKASGYAWGGYGNGLPLPSTFPAVFDPNHFQDLAMIDSNDASMISWPLPTTFPYLRYRDLQNDFSNFYLSGSVPWLKIPFLRDGYRAGIAVKIHLHLFGATDYWQQISRRWSSQFKALL